MKVHTTKLYFAYGSNMNLRQMKYRCPDAIAIGHAVLKDWGLKEKRYADIEEEEGGEVHGLLWEITDTCMQSLDRYEGYPNYYIRKTVEVELNGKPVEALVYVMTVGCSGRRDNQPFPKDYRQNCRMGAIENNIPVDRLFQNP